MKVHLSRALQSKSYDYFFIRRVLCGIKLSAKYCTENAEEVSCKSCLRQLGMRGSR